MDQAMLFDVPRDLFDVRHRFIRLDGEPPMHYVDEGEGPTLLLLHGNPGWSFQYRNVIGALRNQHRCVALDYPGFGLSASPRAGYGFTPREYSIVVERFVDALGLGDLTLVVHDWGGPIGFALAGRRPELVRRVVIGNTWAWPTNPRSARGRFARIMGGPIGRFLQINFNGFIRIAYGRTVTRRLPPKVIKMYLRPHRARARRRAVAIFPGEILRSNGYLAEVQAGLARIGDRPVLILWGTRDPGFPADDRVRFEATFPNHRTVLFDNAAHFLFEEAPDEIVAAMRDFLRDGD